MNRMKKLTVACCLALGLGAGAAQAADRALLIGVGKFQNPDHNLPGIDLDIGIMKEVAESLGFAPANIKVLMDSDATLDKVRGTMDSWLVKGAGPDDRVLIYFSSHGTQVPDENGDEDDGADEALTMHDVAAIRRNGKVTLSGALLDDDFDRILSSMRSKNVLVLIDACHSGTATKSISLGTRSMGIDEGVAKFFSYKDMPVSTRGFVAEGRNKAGGKTGYVAISAAADNEKSIATQRGSVFTLGIKEAVISTKSEGAGSLTPRKMWLVANDFVKQNLPADRLFHPQINGQATLMDQAVTMPATAQGHGPVWRKVEALADGASGVSLQVDKQTYYEGDKMVMRVQVPTDGYLNIVSVGPDDVATVLFPNQFHQDNRVTAGAVSLPTEKMDFDLVARAPYGAALTVALVSKQPVNLFQNADGQRDTKGVLLESFGRLSEDGLVSARSIKAEKREKNSFLAGKLETRVCKSASSCN